MTLIYSVEAILLSKKFFVKCRYAAPREPHQAKSQSRASSPFPCTASFP